LPFARAFRNPALTRSTIKIRTNSATAPSTVKSSCHAIRPPGFQKFKLKMPVLAAKVGLSARALIEKYLVPLLSATTTKFCQYQGKFTDSRTVADNQAQLVTLDIAFRLHRAYAHNESPTGD